MDANHDKLLFVYNANGGLFNTVADIAHKFLSPNTYRCQLCALSHSHFTMRKEWKSFLKSLSVDCEFLHADQFRNRYPDKLVDLPAIFREKADGMWVCLSAVMINRCGSLDELKRLIAERYAVDLEAVSTDIDSDDTFCYE
jgi:hypothetical protein